MNTTTEKQRVIKPPFRKLRAYAFDPSLSIQLDNAIINNITYKVPWEDLEPGPVGEYIEVIDYDPTVERLCKPVDLEERYILAQDGLNPSDSNPQFHQQMVYAVAMTTIRNFEKALGRRVTWSPYWGSNSNKGKLDYVQRLRIYPHALRESNAYYSPQKKAVLFGYFSASPRNTGAMLPGATVFTCLSHDIIAHEISHALLDGVHRRYIEATHPDSLAFHEAFADIVALFQHFTFPEVLSSQIAKTSGDLSSENLLGQLAQEFGKAIGHYGSLRDALGSFDENKGKWIPHQPTPGEYKKIKEAHKRGSLLVAAIFDMFISVYKKRVADLVRLASNGSGILPLGALHPDLVNRMAKEASKTARHVLNMCIRALDYCPPVDVNFGDYLKALITADFDLVEDDEWDYRIALIEAFQKRGIYPNGLKNLSVESLLLKTGRPDDETENKVNKIMELLKQFKEKTSYVTNRKELYNLTRKFIEGGNSKKFGLTGNNKGLHKLFFEPDTKTGKIAPIPGIIFDKEQAVQMGLTLDEKTRMPIMEVHSLKIVNRVGPSGQIVNQILITLTQKRGVIGKPGKYMNPEIIGFFNPDSIKAGGYHKDGTKINFPGDPNVKEFEAILPRGWFIFRGGCTLIFDLNYNENTDDMRLEYLITKGIDDEERMKNQFRMLYLTEDQSLNSTYFGSAQKNLHGEPFAIIHKVL